VYDVVISGTGLYTPAHSISNEELVASFNTFVQRHNAENAAAIEAGEMQPLAESSAAFIEKASGIKSRFVTDKDGILDPQRMVPRIAERSNDQWSILCEMSVKAAEQALARAGKTAADIDGVIVACSNLQRAYPAIAIEVQAALGIKGFGFDMNVACSSATFGIQNAANSIRLGQARAVLMVNPEICTGHMNFRDRDSHFIFGDACTAVVLERADLATSPYQWEVLSSKLATEFSNNIRNNFGFLNRAAEEHKDDPDKLFIQEGRKVFKEVCPMVAELIGEHLAENGQFGGLGDRLPQTPGRPAGRLRWRAELLRCRLFDRQRHSAQALIRRLTAAQPAVNSRIRASTAFMPLLREGDSWRPRPSRSNQSDTSTAASWAASSPLTRSSSTASRPRSNRASLVARNCQHPSCRSPTSQTWLSQPATRLASLRSSSASGARRSPRCISRRARCSQLPAWAKSARVSLAAVGNSFIGAAPRRRPAP